MHAVLRTYSGPGAGDLFDRLEKGRQEVEALLRAVDGFVSYTLVRLDDGGFSLTVCRDRAGTDESSRVARDWVRQHAGDTGVGAPKVSEGPVILQAS